MKWKCCELNALSSSKIRILFIHLFFNQKTDLKSLQVEFAEPFQGFGSWTVSTKSMSCHHFNVKQVISLASSCSRFLMSQRTWELTNLTLRWHLALEWPAKKKCRMEVQFNLNWLDWYINRKCFLTRRSLCYHLPNTETLQGLCWKTTSSKKKNHPV